MHPKLVRDIKCITVLGSILLLTSCANNPIYPSGESTAPANVEDRDVLTQDAQSTTASETNIDVSDLDERRENVARAEYYREQAQLGESGIARIDAVLSSAEYYIQGKDFGRAELTIAPVLGVQMSTVQQHRRDIILAYVAYSRGDYNDALQQLKNVLTIAPPEPPVTGEPNTHISPPVLSTQQVDALLLSSFCYQKLNDYDSVIRALVARERALVGASRAETTRYLWQIINSIPVERREQMIASTQYPLVRNRLEQSLSGQISALPLEPQQFGQWREESAVTQKNTLDSNWGVNSPREIAVLLPLTSKFNKAAQAVMDGIKSQHQENLSANRPRLQFYDIGENPYQVAQYYSAAIQRGADFIIGPLGKDYANQLNNFANGQAPTILLGGDLPLANGNTRLTLSPEMEGVRVAERALRAGHLSAAVLATNNISSQRTIAAFKNRWLENGGKITKTITYSPTQFDHSVELKQLFDVNQSEYRHRRLSATLGVTPKFSAYQRSDIDFIFMIADNSSGRIVLPQINFYSGSRIPVYSTSAVFNGIQDPVNNVDLDGIRFPAMPWVLRSANVAQYAGQLNMLFALGSDAYRVAGNYQGLRGNPNSAINGNTGQLSISAYGEINYQPLWAQFKNGEAIANDAFGIDLTPLNALEKDSLGRPINKNVKGNYNDSNWDPRQSRRKAGT